MAWARAAVNNGRAIPVPVVLLLSLLGPLMSLFFGGYSLVHLLIVCSISLNIALPTQSRDFTETCKEPFFPKRNASHKQDQKVFRKKVVSSNKLGIVG